MNYRLTTILLAVALLLILGVGITQASPQTQPPAAEKQVAPAGSYDFTNHGTGWVNEAPMQLQLLFKGWGAVAKAKTTPGSYWVHIPIPYTSALAGSAMKIQYVEFCAQSTNGAVAKPVQMDLWEYAGKFYTQPIAWPADGAKHCIGHVFNPITWRQDLGISVLLSLGNTTDKVTLYKAWVRVFP